MSAEVTRADIINQYRKLGIALPPDLLPKASPVRAGVGNGEVLALAVTLNLKTVSEANVTGQLRAKMARKKSQRNVVRTAMAKLAGMLPQLPVIVQLTRKGPKFLDDDNLASSLKAVRDGIADVIGVDDGDSRYRWLYKQLPTHGRTYAVEIHIQSITEDSHAGSQKDIPARKSPPAAGVPKAVAPETKRANEAAGIE